MSQKIMLVVGLILLSWLEMNPAGAAPSVKDALKPVPMQQGVAYDQPTPDEIKKCTIRLEKKKNQTAWVVQDPNGLILRSFADSNQDNKLDNWSYYQNGLLIYRDIDSDFSGKVDQYRWFHTAGSRWGHDSNEDGKIDYWKSISAEELAEEVVAALSQQDVQRFQRLLLNQRELSSLGMNKESSQQLAGRVKNSLAIFQKTAKQFSDKSQFSDFGGGRPGIVPAGTRGLKQDLLVYENVWAMVTQGDKHSQLQLGTIMQVAGAWKLVDGPLSDESGKTIAGFFFQSDKAPTTPAQIAAANTGPSEKMQKILESLEKLDEKIASAAPSQQANLNGQRADLLEELAKSAPDRGQQLQWLGQMADMVSAAVQTGQYPQGLARLKSLENRLAGQKSSADIHAHFLFRRLQAEYGLSLSQPKADYTKIQADWLKQLEAFVEQHGQCEHASEALLQLAMASEFAEEPSKAEAWYQRILDDFPQSQAALKSKGALTRLTSVGKPLVLQGPSLTGGKLSLSQYQGKLTLIQYWSTSCVPCKADHSIIKELYAKYGGQNFDVLGVNLDYSSEEALAYLKVNRLPWKHLFEPGGFDSRLANEVGMITLPLMLLVDQKGVVISNSIQSAELEEELKKQLAALGTRTAKRK